MTTLVVGATGATGRLLVGQLLEAGQKVKVIVRAASNIPDFWNSNDRITIIKSNITEITVDELSELLSDCQAIASCLGHTMTLKGIYGKPKELVYQAVRLLCEAALKNAPEKTVKFILMNTAGNSNRDLDEPISTGQKIVIGLVRKLVPPHADNEKAADYLRVDIGQQNRHIEWVVVRPDTLINEENGSEYSLYVSPTRSAIFNPGKTSRLNVARAMTRLISDGNLWNQWKGQMPVIYNLND